ncbi:unnamed protein product, partial [Symbiodinium sp. CCMP2456]
KAALLQAHLRRRGLSCLRPPRHVPGDRLHGSRAQVQEIRHRRRLGGATGALAGRFGWFHHLEVLRHARVGSTASPCEATVGEIERRRAHIQSGSCEFSLHRQGRCTIALPGGGHRKFSLCRRIGILSCKRSLRRYAGRAFAQCFVWRLVCCFPVSGGDHCVCELQQRRSDLYAFRCWVCSLPICSSWELHGILSIPGRSRKRTRRWKHRSGFVWFAFRRCARSITLWSSEHRTGRLPVPGSEQKCVLQQHRSRFFWDAFRRC